MSLRSRVGERVTIAASPPAEGLSQNVIARLPGGSCRVVVGGHYDTVPGVVGANDNASGTALTLALAQAWIEHPAARDICFVVFGAEELGLHGSIHYVDQLQATGQIGDVTAMLNLDAIGDGASPVLIVASTELRSLGIAVAHALRVDASLGPIPTTVGSDHMSFALAGVPSVFVFPPGAILHTPLDNLNNFDPELFTEIARFNHGVLACLLERAGSEIAPSLPCDGDSSSRQSK